MEKKKVVYRALRFGHVHEKWEYLDAAMPRQVWKNLCDLYYRANTKESIEYLRSQGWSVKRAEIPVEEPVSSVVEGWPAPESSGWKHTDPESNDEQVCAIIAFLFAIFLLCLMGAAAALHT